VGLALLAAGAGGFTARERAAIPFAEKLAVDHHNIGDDDVAAMRRLFTDAEFLELWRGSTSASAGCWRCCSWRWRVVRCEGGRVSQQAKLAC
jgi:alkylhydroperoxidase family enzyme